MTPVFEPIPVSYKETLHQVFDQSTQGFQVIDLNWRYLYVNKAAARQGKSTQQELIGHRMMDKYPGIENTPLFAQLKRVMKDKVSLKMENEFQYPDGKKGWFRLFIHPSADGIIIFSVDITQRKKTEEKLFQIIKELETDPDLKNDATFKKLKKEITKLSQSTPELI